MNIREFKECVEFNIKHGLRHAVLGLGAPGVGKSQAVKQIGEKYGYKVIDLSRRMVELIGHTADSYILKAGQTKDLKLPLPVRQEKK